MRILILDRFDLNAEPHYNIDKQSLEKLMICSGYLVYKANVILYISFNKSDPKNIFITQMCHGYDYSDFMFTTHNDEYVINTMKTLQNDLNIISSRYLYLSELSSQHKEIFVTLDHKKFVADELRKITNREYYLIKNLRFKIRDGINQKIYSFLNHKLYFIIMDAWEKFWMVVLGCIISCVLYVGVNFCLSEKRTIRYELGQNHKIEKIIENSADEGVLDVTNWESEKIIMVLDSLNASLVKYPDSRLTK